MKRRKGIVGRVLGGMALMASGLLASQEAHAAVNVACTQTALRNAIAAADLGGDGDLYLPSGCTVNLTGPYLSGLFGPTGLPVITAPISITGLGVGATIARSPSASAKFRIIDVADPGVLLNGNLTLNHITVQNGLTDAGVDAFICERIGGAPDHPMTLRFPEGEYLKGLTVVRKP